MKSDKFFKLEEKSNGHMFGNRKPVEILGGRTAGFERSENDITTGLQDIFTNTKRAPLEELSKDDKVKFRNI